MYTIYTCMIETHSQNRNKCTNVHTRCQTRVYVKVLYINKNKTKNTQYTPVKQIYIRSSGGIHTVCLKFMYLSTHKYIKKKKWGGGGANRSLRTYMYTILYMNDSDACSKTQTIKYIYIYIYIYI